MTDTNPTAALRAAREALEAWAAWWNDPCVLTRKNAQSKAAAALHLIDAAIAEGEKGKDTARADALEEAAKVVVELTRIKPGSSGDWFHDRMKIGDRLATAIRSLKDTPHG